LKKIKVFLLLSIFSAAVLLGRFIAVREKQDTEVLTEANPRISIGTDFKLTYRYTFCGHELQDEKERYIDMDRAEFEAALEGAQISKFSTQKVRAQKHIENYCPRHEIVMLMGERLCVVCTQKGSDVLRIKRDLGIGIEEIDPSHIGELERGMVVTMGRTVSEIVGRVKRAEIDGKLQKNA